MCGFPFPTKLSLSQRRSLAFLLFFPHSAGKEWEGVRVVFGCWLGSVCHKGISYPWSVGMCRIYLWTWTDLMVFLTQGEASTFEISEYQDNYETDCVNFLLKNLIQFWKALKVLISLINLLWNWIIRSNTCVFPGCLLRLFNSKGRQ